jgi:hypothetical protein
MPVRRALAVAVACAALLMAALGPMTRGSVANVASMPLARDVLADRAEQMLRKLGYTEPVADRALGLGVNRDYLRWGERTARTTGGTTVAAGGRRRSRSGIAPVRKSSSRSTCSAAASSRTIRR